MSAWPTLRGSLDDLVADLRHARRAGDLGRLALIAYCEVRRWARQAQESSIAAHSAAMITEDPHASRESFLAQIDDLIGELERAQSRMLAAEPLAVAARIDRGPGHAPLR